MRKLHKRWQMLLYAAAGMGVNMLNLMMGSYLCSAVLIGGFEGVALKNQTFEQRNLVIAAVWATFVTVAKIIDGIIDIPMASFTDRLKTRWGRRRPSIIIGLIPMIISFLLFLWVPNPGGATLLNTIYYGVILVVFYSFYTLTMVTYYATFTEIVDNEDDRNFISNVKSVCDILYFILGYVVVIQMLGGMNIRKVSLIILPIVLTMLIPLFLIKEKPYATGSIENSQSVNLFKSLKHTLTNKTYIIWMIVYALMTFGVQLFLGGINEYFSTVNMNMMLVMIAAFGPVPFTLIIYNKLIHKKGFGFAFRYTLIIYSLAMFLIYGVSLLKGEPLRTVLAICGGLVCSFSIGSLFAVAYSIPAQLAAEEEEKTGISNSAMYFAVQGLFSGVASGIATGPVLVALKEASKNGHFFNVSFLTVVAGLGTFAAFLSTFILPKHVMNMGKKEK